MDMTNAQAEYNSEEMQDIKAQTVGETLKFLRHFGVEIGDLPFRSFEESGFDAKKAVKHFEDFRTKLKEKYFPED